MMTLSTGCAQKAVVQQTSEIKELERLELNASLPPKGVPVEIKVDGTSYAGFDLNGMNALNQYAAQAKANTEALNTLVMAHNAVIDQHNLLVKYAKQQENRANENYKLYVEEYNERQNDKRWFTLERLFLQLVIVGLAL